MTIKNRYQAFLLLLGDLAVFLVSLWLTLAIRYQGIPTKELWNLHLTPFSIVFAVSILIFFISGLYDKQTNRFLSDLPRTITYAQSINALIAIIFFYFIPFFGIAPKVNLFIFLALSSVFTIAWRVGVFARIRTEKHRAIVIGSGSDINELVQELGSNKRYGMTIIDVITLDRTEEAKARVPDLVSRENVDTVIIDMQSEKVASLLPHLYKMIFSRVIFLDAYKAYEDVFDRTPLTLLRYSWFLENISVTPKVLYDALKRIMDTLLALVFGAALFIVYPIIWLCVKLEDGGPVFIKQKRMGKYNVEMEVYKFRTMQANENGVWLKESGNRITNVGKVLRALSLDELPQVINILKGEMSFIGPRNDLTGISARLSEVLPFYEVRYMVKPGISGWAQTHQHYSPGNVSPQSIEESRVRLAYDLYYLKNRSFILDCNIALRTLKTLLSRIGF